MDAETLNQTDSRTFLRTLDTALRDRGDGDSSLGLIVANVENFDHLKSVFGHRNTMSLLTDIARLLNEIVGDEDAVIRFGEGKFGILLRRLKNQGHLVLAANKILRTINRSFDIGGQHIEAELQMGAVVSSNGSGDAELVLQQAETALLAARQDNADFLLYEPEQTSRIRSALYLEKEIDAALEHNEISMFYQPKIATDSWLPVGAEALMRWSHPTRGFVPPDLFIPVADAGGQIEPLTWFGMNAAFRQLNDWPRTWGSLSVAVNVTPRLVEQADLVEQVGTARSLWNVPEGSVTIEVTENALMHPGQSFTTLQALRELGIRVSIDDFGTGYSSLSYFNGIPADELKIDQSFVRKMLEDEGYARIVRTIINLAHDFGLQVTAEGVEDEQTADALAALGCDYLQGYYFSRPLPQSDFIAWLSDYCAER